MQVFRTVVFFSAVGCFIVIQNGKKRVKICDNENKIDVYEEASGDDTDDSESKETITLVFRNAHMRKKIPRDIREPLMINFDVEDSWNFNFKKNSRVKKILMVSVERYFSDLAKRYHASANLKLSGIEASQSSSGDFTRIKLDIVCEKQSHKSADDCPTIVESIASKLNVKELLVYFHDMGSFGEIVPIESETTNVDIPELAMIPLALETDEIVQEVVTLKEDFYFDGQVQESVNEMIYLKADAKSDVRNSHSQEEENFIEPKGDFDFEENLEDSQLFVNHVEKLSENRFMVQVFLEGVWDETDEFKEQFKLYTEDLYWQDPKFENSTIGVVVLRVRVEELGNETSVRFVLKTFNIPIEDIDLELENKTSVFDVIFENFDVYEFKVRLGHEEESTSEEEDVEIVTQRFDYENETAADSDETTLADVISEFSTLQENFVNEETTILFSSLPDNETLEANEAIPIAVDSPWIEDKDRAHSISPKTLPKLFVVTSLVITLIVFQ